MTLHHIPLLNNPQPQITLSQLAPNSRQATTVKTRIKELLNDP